MPVVAVAALLMVNNATCFGIGVLLALWLMR